MLRIMVIFLLKLWRYWNYWLSLATSKSRWVRPILPSHIRKLCISSFRYVIWSSDFCNGDTSSCLTIYYKIHFIYNPSTIISLPYSQPPHFFLYSLVSSYYIISSVNLLRFSVFASYFAAFGISALNVDTISFTLSLLKSRLSQFYLAFSIFFEYSYFSFWSINFLPSSLNDSSSY